MDRHKNITYYFRTSLNADVPLGITACGYDICTPGYRIDRKEFFGYGFDYVVKGKGTFRDAKGEQPLSAGLLFCYSKHAPHSYWTDPANPMEKFWVAFQGNDAPGLIKKTLGSLSGVYRLFDPGSISSLFETIIDEAAQTHVTSGEICEYYLRILLAKMKVTVMSGEGRGLASLNVFRNCRSYIDEHFFRLDSPFAASRQHHITDSYLCQLFRRYAGVSPHQYLLGLKMNKAAHFLTTTGHPVKRIALELCFADQYSFSRAFKRHFGLSPQHYRQER